MNADRTRSGATARRRAAVLVLLVAGLVFGSSLPSWAAFTDTTSVSAAITTATVAPPANLTARTKCAGNTATVTLNWAASTAARVSGYRVRVYLGEAWQDQGTVAGTATTWQGNADTFYVSNYTMTFTVSTLTEYGWTAESLRTARIIC
jgi:hypothetical protein